MISEVDKKQFQEMIDVSLAKFFDRHLSFRAFKNTDTTNDVFGVNNKTSGSVPVNGVGQANMQDDAVGKAELKYEIVTVTVSAGQSLGTGTATASSQIIGFFPTTNCDQIVDNISLSGTTLTVNLNANATADCLINVVLIQP